MPNADFEILQKLVTSRRTVKDFDGRPVARQDLESLLELANWAPNHHMNAPWFFRVLTQAGIRSWLDYLDRHLSSTDKALLNKPLEKLKQIGALIHVTSKREENLNLQNENHAAVSAAIQNILLGATALQIQSFWSTSKIASLPETKDFLNIKPQEEIVGALWLGYGILPDAKPRIPIRERSLWFEK